MVTCADKMVGIFCRRRSPHKAVLIVKLDLIGDFFLWANSARILIDHYHSENCHVVLLANHAWSDTARKLDLGDEVWAIDSFRMNHDLGYRWAWLRRIRKASFQIAVHPCFSRGFLDGDAVIRATGAKERIGSAGDTSNVHAFLKPWADSWYSRLVPVAAGCRHEIFRNEEFVDAVCGSNVSVCRSRRSVFARSQTAATTRPERYAVFFPGASWTGKCWPVDRFIEIAVKAAEAGFEIVVAGGEAELGLEKGFASRLGPRTRSVVGTTSLETLTELICHADLVVTNDTSAVHIAAAFGVPAVCIAGGGHFGRFVPYPEVTESPARTRPSIVFNQMPCFNCDWKCIYPRDSGQPVRCIADVTIDQVWRAVANSTHRK